MKAEAASFEDAATSQKKTQEVPQMKEERKKWREREKKCGNES